MQASTAMGRGAYGHCLAQDLQACLGADCTACRLNCSRCWIPLPGCRLQLGLYQQRVSQGLRRGQGPKRFFASRILHRG